jgi:hypothetical protein
VAEAVRLEELGVSSSTSAASADLVASLRIFANRRAAIR